MDNYMRALFHLTNDPSKDIRKRVCQAFVILLEVKFQYLQAHMHNVIRYMLMATDDEDDDVALEACEFWSAYCETKVRGRKRRKRERITIWMDMLSDVAVYFCHGMFVMMTLFHISPFSCIHVRVR